MSTESGFYKNFSWLFVEKFIRFLLTTFSNIFIARTLGVEASGVLNYALALVLTFSFLATTSLDTFYVEMLIRKANKEIRFLKVIRQIKLIGAVFCIGVISGIVWFDHSLHTDVKLLLIFMSFSTILNQFDFVDLYFQSRSLNKLSSASRIGSQVLATILRVFAALLHWPLFVFGIIQCIELLLLSTFQMLQFRKWPLLFPFRKRDLLFFSKKVYPLLLCSILVLIYTRADQVFLGKILGFEELGQYGAAARLLETILVFPVIFNTALLPKLSRYISSKGTTEKDSVLQICGFYLIFSFSLSLGGAFSSEFLLKSLYGRDFAAAATPFSILCLSVPAMYFGVIRHSILILRKKLIIPLQLEGLTAFFSICFNIVLTPKFGAKGAALSFLLATSLTNVIAVVFYTEVREVFRIFTKSLIYVWNRRFL